MVFPVLAYFGMQTQRIGEAAAVSVAMLPVLAILVIFATIADAAGRGLMSAVATPLDTTRRRRGAVPRAPQIRRSAASSPTPR